MKNIKVFLSLFVMVSLILLSSCDVVYDYLYDDIFSQYGDVIFGDADLDPSDDEIFDDEDFEEGNGDVPDLGGDDEDDKVDTDAPHTCVFGAWETVKAATCSETGLSVRECGICDNYEERTLDTIDHTGVFVMGKDASCTEKGTTDGYICEDCNLILNGVEDIPAKGHTEAIDPAIPGSDTTPAKTEGRYCSACGYVIVRAEYVYTGKYTSPDSYSSSYAYDYLLTLDNGASIREFYLEIDEAVRAFHHSDADAVVKTTKNGEMVYMIGELLYSDNGLTNDEAIAAWCAYKFDHPLYYWMSNEISYNLNGGTVSVLTYQEYALSAVRIAYNEEIYEAVKVMVEGVMGEGDYYRIALSLHDGLIKNADYAYEADGKTPSDEPFAHNIIGVMLDGSGVCESYAKSFQLLLNYFNIENVYVSGRTTEAHAWNLVKLDDGEWYWFDLTWDDRPSWGNGITHNYFCVTDNTVVNYFDGAVAENPVTMSEDHIPSEGGRLGTSFFYTLPERSDSEYDYDTFIIRDEIIKQDGLSYVIVGFREVALIEIDKDGDVIIPESITLDGIEFKVVMIGAYSDGLFRVGGVVKIYNTSPFVTAKVTSVTIPKTVSFIFDNAFTRCNTIKSFTVDDENPYFSDYNGALYTKSQYTLIAYPFASESRELVIPEWTREIAYYALGDGGNVLYAKNLKRIDLGSDLLYIGVLGSVYGYSDTVRPDESTLSIDEGYVDKLYSMYPWLILEYN